MSVYLKKLPGWELLVETRRGNGCGAITVASVSFDRRKFLRFCEIEYNSRSHFPEEDAIKLAESLFGDVSNNFGTIPDGFTEIKGIEWLHFKHCSIQLLGVSPETYLTVRERLAGDKDSLGY
ncbi:MAG: hypothetical protein KGJ13_08970 [Patescibacteria group bacterium]|nr:hypothetical protein [Patescibacteria group bacterium]